MADTGLGHQSGQMTLRHLLIPPVLLAALAAGAEKSNTPANAVAASYTATTANVSGAPGNIRVEILRWSTPEERTKLRDAWDLKTADTGRGRRGGAGRGAAAGGRGGRGATEGETAASGPAPEAMLAKALKQATTVGYLWSSEIAGYAIRYAEQTQNPDGSSKIILLTDRRLGAVNDLWKPAGGDALPYDFSLIEIRRKPNGDGEGKTSLTGKVVPENTLKIVALENYDSL